MISGDELQVLILRRITPAMRACARGEQLIENCAEVEAMFQLRCLLAHIMSEAVLFCVTVKALAPFCTVEERAMTRESRPVVDALEMAAAYLDGRLGPRGQVGQLDQIALSAGKCGHGGYGGRGDE